MERFDGSGEILRISYCRFNIFEILKSNKFRGQIFETNASNGANFNTKRLSWKKNLQKIHNANGFQITSKQHSSHFLLIFKRTHPICSFQ